MKYLIFLLFPILGMSQTGLWTSTEITVEDGLVVPFGNEPTESITKVELKNDTLYVYKKVYPNRTTSCAVLHYDGHCSWNDPYKLRDVYVVENGKIELTRTDRPKYKVVKKEVEETIESW